MGQMHRKGKDFDDMGHMPARQSRATREFQLLLCLRARGMAKITECHFPLRILAQVDLRTGVFEALESE